jgi:hypothetical protein
MTRRLSGLPHGKITKKYTRTIRNSGVITGWLADCHECGVEVEFAKGPSLSTQPPPPHVFTTRDKPDNYARCWACANPKEDE